LTKLKRAAGVASSAEIKLRDLDENDYFDFLSRLGTLRGVLYSVATDAGVNRVDDVVAHQRQQAEKITEHKAKLHHAKAREGLEALATQVRELAPQLYVQLFCQIDLISEIVKYGSLYFVQRLPRTLGNFRWRIDQKNSIQTEYERAFLTLTPPILQTISLRDPLIMMIGADYSSFRRFDYPAGEAPTYLKDDYGIDLREDGPKLNLGKLMREDLKFEDSTENQGVQVADLLAAGVRRCLRSQFKDSRSAARLLGRLMVQAKKPRPPIRLLGFAGAEEAVNDDVARLLNIMRKTCRPLVAD
jgi:hypothetical protein